jgi:hypothetical protein
MFFPLKLMSEKDIYKINHCASIIKKSKFFCVVGHCIIGLSNLMLHLTCCAHLVLACFEGIYF